MMQTVSEPIARVAKEYPPIVNEAQCADMVAMSAEWLRLRRAMGDGPPFMKIGRAVRYDRDVVLGWFRAREVARP